jgi:Luciferase-like monooxygenase
MEFGVHLPLTPIAGEQCSFEDLLAFTEAARDLGYTHLCANDHLVFSRPWLDGPTALAAVLAHSQMTLATTVAVPVLRGPAATAKILAAIDLLSGGRLVVGLGLVPLLGTTSWLACDSRSAGSGWTRQCRRCARTGATTASRLRVRSTPRPASRWARRRRSAPVHRSGSGAGVRWRG